MRRIHLSKLQIGQIVLPSAQAHYLRDVLRLAVGTEVEAFDVAGAVGKGMIAALSDNHVTIEIRRIEQTEPAAGRLTVASAIPKAARADWMIEKLSELGVDRFIPLAAERSVVLPDGEKKFERWQRLAAEAARQSQRSGIMQIDPLISLEPLISRKSDADGLRWHLAIRPDAQPMVDLVASLPSMSILIFIGPEGGWTPGETAAFQAANIPPVLLTPTTLRVETAAVAAAAIIQSALTARAPRATIAAGVASSPSNHQPEFP